MSDKEETRQKIEKLKQKIKELNYRYFVLDKSEVTEDVRDSLKRKLRQLEAEYPELITPDSPTQRVGSVLSGKFDKVAHITPKKSLQDVFSKEELLDWVERIQKLVPGEEIAYICELKIDGLNITLHYKKGRFVRALTRGNGEKGEDVTHTIKTIESIPMELNKPIDLEVSGEVYLSKKTFEKINKEQSSSGEEKFANPRNAAAGTIRQLNPAVAASRDLKAFFYEIGANSIFPKISSQSASLEALWKLGIKINTHYRVCKNINEAAHFIEEVPRKREKFPYEIDGIVIKVNSKKQWEKMGFTAKAPRYAVAYKFQPKQAISRITDIIIQVGRTGVLTPVAVMEPTEVSGSTVSRATLHNEDEMSKKDVRIGDTVILQKAGDVIPEVVSVLKDLRTGREKKFHFPNRCPVCGSAVKREEGMAAYRCTNKNCFAIQREGLTHFASKNAMNIEGLGEKVILQLLEAGLIKTPPDIFKLTHENLLTLPLFKEKRAQNILDSIEKSKNIPLNKFLFALGIRYLGEQNSFDFAKYILQEAGNPKHFTILDLIKSFESITPEELDLIEGIGSKVASGVSNYITNKKHLEMLRELHDLGVKLTIKQPAHAPLAGKSFVITGSLESMTRDQAKDKIKSLGGRVLNSITRETNYLIVGEDPGGKLAHAREINIKTLNEKEFLKMLK